MTDNPFDSLPTVNKGQQQTDTQPQEAAAEASDDPFASIPVTGTGTQQPSNGLYQGSFSNDPLAYVHDSAFGSFMEQMNRSFGEMTEGALSWGAKAVGADSLANKISQMQMSENERIKPLTDVYQNAALGGEITAGIGKALPAAVASGGASIMGQVAANGLFGAYQRILENSPKNKSQDEIATEAALGGAAGAGGTVLGAELAGIGGALAKTAPVQKSVGFLQKVFNPKKAAEQTIANEIANTPGGLAGVQGKLQQADELGVPLSWAEASGTDSSKNVLRNLKLPTEEAKADLVNMDTKQTDKVTGMLNDAIERMTPMGQEATETSKDMLYGQLKSFNVNKNKLAEIVDDNPVIGEYIEKATKEKAWGKDILSLSDDNAFKLNEVRKLMKRDIDKGSLDSTAEFGVKRAKKELGNLLETTAKETYTDANALADQVLFKNKVMKQLSEIDTSPGMAEQGNGTFNQIYNKLWNNKKDKTEFLERVTATGGDAGKTEKLINLIDEIRSGTIHNLSSKGVGQATILNSSKATSFTSNILDKVFSNSAYRKQMVEMLIDSKKWAPQVEAILKAKKDPTALGNAFKKAMDAISKSKASTNAAGIGILQHYMKGSKPRNNNEDSFQSSNIAAMGIGG